MEFLEGGHLERWARRLGTYGAVFLAGAVCSFAYSYAPLHQAKDWKIDYLQERIEVKDRQIAQLGTELEDLRVDTADRPDAKTFKQLQQEFAKSDATIASLEKKASRAERKVEDLERARKSWQDKYAGLQAQMRAKTEQRLARNEPEPPAARAAPSGSTADSAGTASAGDSGSSDLTVAIDDNHTPE